MNQKFQVIFGLMDERLFWGLSKSGVARVEKHWTVLLLRGIYFLTSLCALLCFSPNPQVYPYKYMLEDLSIYQVTMRFSIWVNLNLHINRS